MAQSYDVVVAGSGMGGLTAAGLAIFVVVLSFFSVLLLLYALSRYSTWLSSL